MRGRSLRGDQPWRTNRARSLRANDTSAEAKLWSELRDRRLGGLKFVRQAPVAGYFVDFVCRERRTIVEIDGGTHATAREISADAVRSAELERLGFRVYRIANSDVYENLDNVLDAVLAFANEVA